MALSCFLDCKVGVTETSALSVVVGFNFSVYVEGAKDDLRGHP